MYACVGDEDEARLLEDEDDADDDDVEGAVGVAR